MIPVLPPPPDLRIVASLSFPGSYGVYGSSGPPEAPTFAVWRPDHARKTYVLIPITATGTIGEPMPVPTGDVGGVTASGAYTLALLDPRSPTRLLLRDLTRNRGRHPPRDPPATHFQTPEIRLASPSKLYYLANEDAVKTPPPNLLLLLLLREREAEPGEAQYARYLVEASLPSGQKTGTARVLARVETPGRAGSDLTTGGPTPRAARSVGRDLVAMPDGTLVVRADERIFILARL